MSQDTQNTQDLAELVSMLEEVTDAYERLLDVYAKPFGWGKITSDRAREVIAKHRQPAFITISLDWITGTITFH